MKTNPQPWESANGSQPPDGPERYLGIDVGAETIKLVELVRDQGRPTLHLCRRRIVEHNKSPEAVLRQLLAEWDWATVRGAAVCGRFSRHINLPHVPIQQAQARAWRHLGDDQPATLVSIGSHGFSVLELRASGLEVFRENSRCSQGTGNFLRQLVERFSLTIEAASAQAAAVEKSASLSGRCPVILKSDMTHLANKGEDRARILAGLFDAVSANVQVLIKPAVSPSRVALLGGVSRAPRIRRAFDEFLRAHAMTLLPLAEDDGLFFEALGCALVAAPTGAGGPPARPPLALLCHDAPAAHMEKLPPLAASLAKVRRMPARVPAPVTHGEARSLVLGFDIGSTGSKAVALDARSNEMVWEGYRPTLGDPVGAAQALLESFTRGPAAGCPVLAVGATGSGREIVGSLLATCYGKEAVFILNEIAAHAAGALSYDPRVDTIFEIGGQDAKYTRLAEGRVVDCAMNEACSAGTGSFIEEQGRKFSGIRDVVHFGEEALAATEGVSLGQHCSVFMSEVIDEAVAAGVGQRPIIAGLYDSIIQNYLHRVKGNRSVGKVIFCQGMPFSSDALAAAVARQTGSEVVVPPNPGTVGALGIALLTLRASAGPGRPALDLTRFLGARVEAKDNFLCQAKTGCGIGNHCRIERLRTLVEARRQSFTWGGGCALHDKGTRKQKLPDLAPDPFREREALVQQLVAACSPRRGGRTVAVSDEFMLKGLFPFVITFLHELGLDPVVVSGGDHATLKRGIQKANVPFCAPMQQFHGLVSRMAETDADFLFLPMIRSLPKINGEPHAVTCPIAQAGPDIVKWDLCAARPGRVLSPVIDVGEGNLQSAQFLKFCRQLGQELGVAGWAAAHQVAVEAQGLFEVECLALGQRALTFCAEHRIVPIVVLGRPYTIYNTVLNSNVPAILREQGAIAIPLDCYPVVTAMPAFKDMYWSHGQRILRAAHQIRRTPGLYSLYCSNYSCGPDSFNLHFYAYIMEGRPFAIIETDGHSGDAGTKTRVEAFLHCVAQDLLADDRGAAPRDFAHVQQQPVSVAEIRQRGEILLIPSMGPASALLASCFRGAGLRTECLPQPDAEALRFGRRHTSGKECLPLCLTLGNLLKRLERERSSRERFTMLLTTTHGPCRQGTYNLLNRITLERLGWADRVRIWSPADTGYFDDLPRGLSLLVFSAFMTSDLLLQALHDVRPVETRPGAAQEIYARYYALVQARLETAAGRLSAGGALWQFAGGGLFGLRQLLTSAAAEFAAVRGRQQLPTVLVVGEIYVRCDPFANGFLIEKLEQRGLRARLAPFHEWLDYSDVITRREGKKARRLADRLRSHCLHRIQQTLSRSVADLLGWAETPSMSDVLEGVAPYLRTRLNGEAVLTIGAPLAEWRRGQIDAVVSVGPLECMPNKIAEAQFFHVAEREGLPTLTLPVNGDPGDDAVLDNFAFTVRARSRAIPARPPAGRNLRPPVGPGPVHAPAPCVRACPASASCPPENETCP